MIAEVQGAAPGGSRRILILVAAAAMQLCLGATYSWAVFVGPLRQLTGVAQGTAQLPFTLFYFVFPATMVVAGMLLSRIGPARSAMIGGALFGGGWLLASLGAQGLVLVSLGIGVVAGVGVGFAYIVPIAVGVRWFPNRKGLVTGIAVAGFGGGAALVSQLAGRLLETFSPFEIFRMLGVVFGVTVLCAGSLMRFPPGVQQASAGFRNIAGLLTHQTFRTLYLAMVVGLAAGFAVNANLRELAPARAAETGILAVSAFAVANALGRILWGVLSDRIRPELALRLNLLAQAVVLAGGLLLVRGPSEFVAFASGAGFNYGGVLVLYASTVAKLFGAERVGEVYGLLFTANIVASPAPMVCGYLFDFTGSFAPALGVLIVLLLISTRLKFQHAGTENV